MWGVWVSMSGWQGHCVMWYFQPIRISLKLYWPIRGQVLAHLIVTENCISLFLRQKVSCQTSSLCCHCHCGILNKHRHLDKFDIIKEPRDDLSVQPPLLFLETLHTWDVTDCLFLIFLFRHLLHKLQNLKIKQNFSLYPLTYYFSVSGRLCFGQNKQSSCYEWGTSLLLAEYYPHFELVGWGVCQAIICSFVQISDIRRGVARITRGEDLLTICTSSPEAY